MKRDRDFEALEDGKRGRLDNNLDLESPHLVNSIQQQFLQQQQQYVQHQLQHFQQQQQLQHQQQQQLQHRPPTDHQWSIQGQIVPRPALPAHMLPYAMQSCLPRPYTQPTSLSRHQIPFPQYSAYQNDPNSHYAMSSSYLLHQQTANAQNFTNIPDHTPSPSPSPNPPLSPNIEEYQSSDAIGSVSYESSGAIHKDHSKVVSYSNPPLTHIEYPSPAQSPVEHRAEDLSSNSRQPPNIDPYSLPISTEVVESSVRYPPAVVVNSLSELPINRTTYEDASCVVSANSGIGYTSTVLNSAIDLSASTATTDGHSNSTIQATTPSKDPSVNLSLNQTSVHGHGKELGLNPVILNSPISMPHSPAGFIAPSSPYTSCLPNPPPNSPVVLSSPAVVSYVPHASANIIKFQQLIDNGNNYGSEKNLTFNARHLATGSAEDKNKSDTILKPTENKKNNIHASISVTKHLFEENLHKNITPDSECSNRYIGAFAELIKSDDEEYRSRSGNEESVNCEKEFNPLINEKDKEASVDVCLTDLRNMSNTDEQKEICRQDNNEKINEDNSTEVNNMDKELDKKPFKFSPYLYRYLNNEQKDDGIETLDWCSEMCTPPDSPLATSSSTPTSSPTAIPVPFITLTPCASYLYTSDENSSAISELRDDQGILCQGGDILMRTADGSLRLVGSPVKLDDTTITAGSMSPCFQLESPSKSAAHLPKSATSSPGSDILGDIMTQVGLVGVSAEEDMCLDEDVIGVMEEKGPSPSFVGEAQEMGYHQQRQFACHLCHCVFHDAWNLQVHMVSHPTPTPRPRRRSKTSISSPETATTYAEEYSEFIPPHLTPSLPKGTKFRRGGRRVTNKENTNPQQNIIGKFLCPECNIGYPSQGHMRRHMESHGANRKFPCDMCTASYSRRDNLDKHRNMHFMNDISSTYL